MDKIFAINICTYSVLHALSHGNKEIGHILAEIRNIRPVYDVSGNSFSDWTMRRSTKRDVSR